MIKKQCASLVAATVVLSGTTAFCQQQDTVPVLGKVQEIIPIEIKAIRVNDKSPFAASNLKEEEIRSLNTGQDIPYVLDQLPSVTVSSDAGAGVGYTGIRIRGTDASRINFTINGIPVNDAESQAAMFVDFPDLLSSTQSIQVQRGVGSSTNGAGAFGASVNLSNLQQSKQAFAEAGSSYGSFNTWKHTVRAGTGDLKGGFRFDIRASKIKSDGYIERSSSDLKSLQFIAGWASADERTSVRFNLFTGTEKTGQAWNGVPQDSLKTNRRYNPLGLKPDGTYYDDQTDNYQQDYYQWFFDHRFDANWSVHAGLFLTRGKGFYNEYRMDEKFSSYGLKDFETPDGFTAKKTDLTRRLWLDNYYYGAVYSLNYQKGNTDLLLGGAYTRYDGKHYGYVTWAQFGIPDNYRWYDLDAFKRDFNVYAKWQQRLGERLYAFADLQFRHVYYEINGFRKNQSLRPKATYDFVNPKLGLSYIAPWDGQKEGKAYLSFAVANKEPNRDDFEASPLQAPLPERLYNTELGYQLRGTGWDLSANLYHMLYKDQLILTGKINDVGTATRTNVPDSYRAGIELAGSVKPLPGWKIVANATFSRNKIQNFTEYIDDYDSGEQIENHYKETDIALSPNTIASLVLSWDVFKGVGNKGGLYVDLIGKHIGRQYLDNTSNAARSIDPYQVCNLRLRYALKPSFVKELGVSLALNNILDKKYASSGYTFSYVYEQKMTTENFYYPQAGFHFLLGLNIQF